MAHQGRSLEGAAPLSHCAREGLIFWEIVGVKPTYIPFLVIQYKCKEKRGGKPRTPYR